MAKINTYQNDVNINPDDILLGSDADTSNKRTKNFRIGDLLDYFSQNRISDGIAYKFGTDHNKRGYFSANSEILKQVTQLKVNAYSETGTDFTDAFNTYPDQNLYIKLVDVSNPSKFAFFNVDQVTKQEKDAYFVMDVTLIGTLGNGKLQSEYTYFFVFAPVQDGPVITKTSQLENDGEDGENPYISFSDLYRGNSLIRYGIYNVENYDYFVWADRYIINNVTYSEYVSGTVTLNDGDDTYDRIDVIVLNEDGTFEVIEGTPSEDPIKPSIDTETQLEVTFVIVTANSTSPSEVETTVMYDEDLQESNEWNTEGVVSRVITNSTEQAFSGIKSVKFNASVFNDRLRLSSTTGFVKTDVDTLVFAIKTSSEPILRIYFESTGDSPTIDRNIPLYITDGNYGYDKNVTDWQVIVIPIQNFNLGNGTYKALQFTNKLNFGTSTFFIDKVFLQKHGGNGGNTGNYLISTNNLSDVENPEESRNNIGAQEKLVSGTNIKTLQGQSLLGGGDLVVNAVIPDYTDIADMLSNQGGQSDGGSYLVQDASADPNITFASGETKLQAEYRFNGVATGSIDDYTLISAPYGNHTGGSGGDAIIEFQPEITDTATIFDGTQKGTGKIYPFNKSTAQTVTIEADDYSENDTINIERRGLGTLEVVQGTDVRFRGVRDEENRFFINDRNSMASLICRGSNEFSIIGNLKRGSLGAVTVSSYLPALAPIETRNITVTGTGFSANMVITVTGNATLNSWTYVSETQITLNITSSGIEGDFLTITYDNGDVFVDTNAIELINVEFLSTNHPFDSGFGLFQMDSSQVYALRLRRSSDDAETDVGFDEYYKVGLNSPVSAGGNLSAWIGGNDGFIVTLYDQGTFGSDLVQATKAAQPKLINAGAMYVFDDIPFLYLDGTDDWMQAVTAQQWASTDNQTVTSIKRRITSEVSATLFSDKEVSQVDSFRIYMSNGAFFNSGNITLTATDTDNTTSQVSAIRRAGVETKLYVNGTLTDTDVAATASTTNRKLNIGQLNAIYAQGYMNHCVIWKSDKIASLASIETLINTFV